MKQKTRGFLSGSALVYTLIVLSVLLTVSLGMMTSSMTDFRSASSVDRSAQAFQVANSGAEEILKKIKDNPNVRIDNLGLGSCTTKDTIEKSLTVGSYQVSFMDKDRKLLKCSKPVNEVEIIKSVGSYADSVRAVENFVPKP